MKDISKKINSSSFPLDLLQLQSHNCNYLLAVLLLAFPPILGLLYIKSFGVNVLYWDQWELVPLIEKVYTGSLSLGDLFSQHNEHRIFFPRIIMLALAHMTYYDTVAEMYFSWILSLLTMLLIFRMHLQHSRNSTGTLVKFIPITWLLFSFRQYENILWGWQIQIYLCVLGFVASIYLLEKTTKLDKNFLLAVSSGVISSFSFVNGLIVWPVGFIYLFLAKKTKGTFPLVWIGAGALVWVVYFYNWIKPQHHPSLLFMMNDPVSSITYFFVSIGSPLSFEKGAAFGNGFLLVTLILFTLIIIVEKKLIVENAKWISFIFFSLFSSLSLTIGRSGFGVEQALSSRYVTLTSLGVIGIYLILSTLYAKFKNENYTNHLILYGVILSLIFMGIVAGYTEGVTEGKQIMDSRETSKYFLVNYGDSANYNYSSLTGLTYLGTDAVVHRIEILKKYNMSVFFNRSNLYAD